MAMIGDALVSKIIEKVIDVGFNYLADQCAWHTGTKEERQRLKDALPRILAVVKAANNALTFQQQIDANPGLQAWLQQLKDAIYEADDALDELDYLRLQKQVEGDTSADERPHKVRRLLTQAKENIKRIFKSDPTLEMLRSAVKRLDEVSAHVGEFYALVASNEQQSQYQQQQSQVICSRETGPLVTESKVFGRDKEREELLQWLTKCQPDKDEMNNVSLYSVIGHGGMGKTTLAQLVYNDEDVQKSFDLKMWVCVSTSFDVRWITAAVLESATAERPKIDNLAPLQDALKNKLMSSNKFLLVLDDVWNVDNWSEWDKLLAPLRYGHKGSKILLTTRMGKVAEMAARAMGGTTKESLQLNPIDRNDFFSIFDRYAFAGISSGDYTQLRHIGMQIAERLGGSPLAAKTIGALLNSNLDERYWTSILHCKNISEQGQQGEGNIMSILMLSYHHLPLYLRPCFAFCSTFPQDYWFHKEDLVLKWMALGFIQHSPQNQGQEPEDVGSCYFDELLSRSFFEKRQWGSSYTMHDLLHDVAHSVSNGECFSIVNDDKSVEEIPNTVRHLYLGINNLNTVMKVDRWQQLRSLHLHITRDYVLDEINQVLEKVFKSLKSVRMLEVGEYVPYAARVMPDVFGHLRHLRSLRITSDIDKFPASLCKLHNLQALHFLVKEYSLALPKDMNNLVSLRHLLVTSSRSDEPICFMIARVRKLSSLQRLGISIKKERDYKIDELEGLNMIRKLHLQGLENVESPEEASMAKLGNKEQLRVLSLGWSHQDNDTERNNPNMDEQQEQILDCLQPHSSLKELTIKRYRGVMAAKWMDFELVNNLQRMSLSDCPRLEHLHSFGKLPFLKYLSLRKMPLVKQLECGCQQLEELNLDSMEGLEELSHSDANSGQWCPSLLKLRIVNSPELSVLPSLALSLQSMYLQNVGLTALPKLWLGGSEGSSSSSSSSLSNLTIQSCRKLTSLDEGLLQQQHYLTALVILKIADCNMLVDFPAGGLQHLRSLRGLEIFHCPILRLDPTVIDPAGNDENFLPSYLSNLYIKNCAELEMSIPTLLLKGTLTSLSSLSLDGMKMKSLPPSSVWRKLASLDSLSISNCEELMSLEPINDHQSLRYLSILGCPKLVCTATTPVATGLTLAIDELSIDDPMLLLSESFRNLTSLRQLVIWDCREVESISGRMEEWLLRSRTTLNILTLDNASSLESLPDSLQTFSSLEHLRLGGTGNLLKERCRKDEGADWPNIKHIPNISIY